MLYRDFSSFLVAGLVATSTLVHAAPTPGGAVFAPRAPDAPVRRFTFFPRDKTSEKASSQIISVTETEQSESIEISNGQKNSNVVIDAQLETKVTQLEIINSQVNKQKNDKRKQELKSNTEVVIIQVVQAIIDVRQGSANVQTLFAVQELTQIAIEIQQQQSKQRKTKHYQVGAQQTMVIGSGSCGNGAALLGGTATASSAIALQTSVAAVDNGTIAVGSNNGTWTSSGSGKKNGIKGKAATGGKKKQKQITLMAAYPDAASTNATAVADPAAAIVGGMLSCGL